MTPATPPRFPRRLLERALADDPAGPAILGDLHEDFVRLARERGPGAARRRYAREATLLATGIHARRLATRLIRVLGTPTGESPMSGSTLLHGLTQDGAYAARTLRRSPGFALFTAAVIGLGVGAATAVFSVLKPLILAPLPFRDPGALVWVANAARPGATSLSAFTSRTSNLTDFRERARSFQGLTGYNAFFDQGAYTLTGDGEPERLVGAGVADDFVDVLGVRPLLGRDFTPEEGKWGGPRALMLTHGFWVRRFAADPGIVGRAITLNDEPWTVVGVLPASFDFSSIFSPGVTVDFLLPWPIAPETDRQGNTTFMIGRLRPGVSPRAAQDELDAIVSALKEEQPRRWGLGAKVDPLQAHIAGPFRPALLLLAAAAGTLLLIVCVNVSNLILARAPGRAREVAVRKALGASRGRLVRQLMLETLSIALAGAALGSLLAWGATHVVAGNAASRVPLLSGVRVDAVALLFAAAVAVLTGLVVGLVPALQVAEGGEAAVLRSGGRGASASRGARRMRETLVIAEVTLACVLLVAGGLLVRSFRAVLDVDLGFDPAHLVAWQLNPGVDFRSDLERTDFYAALADRVAAVPGVERVGFVDASPLGRNRTWGFRVADRPEAEDAPGYSLFPHMVDPGYLPAMGIPLVAGRNFTRDDVDGSEPVVMINETGARTAFPGEEAVGRRILQNDEVRTIVGVVKDVHHLSPELPAGTEVYFPWTQMPDFGTLDMVVRSTLPDARTATAVSGVLREIDPSMPTREFWTMESRLDRAVSARRFTLGILGAFGLAALLLAGLGIYGVLAHSVAERTPEIGIRMALGASTPGVVWSVLGRTLALAAVGVGAGVILSLAGGRLVASLLFGVAATDPATYVGMGFVLLVIAGAAGALPALRAARTTGIRALRAE
jgi:putative ABC transport system permease protein